jgi:hypothetical protein
VLVLGLEDCPVIMMFADCPSAMQAFCFRWNISTPNTRACAVVCSVCKGLMPMALVSDVVIESSQDAQAMLILELEARHWKIVDHGRPVCPNCQ